MPQIAKISGRRSRNGIPRRLRKASFFPPHSATESQ
jgi:hypothetical protein